MRYWIIGLLAVLISAVAIASLYNDGSSFINASTTAKNERIIIIDAGHGGADGGAVASDGTIEKDLNLEVALCLNEELIALGYKTVMTRTEDVSTDTADDSKFNKQEDIKNRLSLMNKYKTAVFISVHMNKYSTSQPNGAQVFYAAVEGSEQLAGFIQSSIKTNVQQSNKRVIKPTDKNIYLLRNATVPAVIVECGFLSNQNDLNNLKSQEYRKSLALAIAKGYQEFLNWEVENNGSKG